MKRLLITGCVLVILGALFPVLAIIQPSQAQDNVVAFLTVDKAGVELRRADTNLWVPVNSESVVGKGDRIRTKNDGEATIRFFGDDLTVEVMPNSLIIISELVTNLGGYRVSLEIAQGQTKHILAKTPSTDSTYELKTPFSSILLREGGVALDVDPNEGVGVISTGQVFAIVKGQAIQIDKGTGLSINVDGSVGSILPVVDFEQLATATNGLKATFTTEADIQLNVRQGPSKDNIILGALTPVEVTQVMGVSNDGNWYRIPYRDVFGWVSIVGLDIEVDGTKLVTFPQDYLEPLAFANTGTGTEVVVTTPVPAVPENTNNTSGPPMPAVFSEYSEEELRLVAGMNEWRLQQGLFPFMPNPILTKMARDQVRYLMSLPSLPNDLHMDAKGLYPRDRAVKDYNWPYYGQPARAAVGENAYAGRNVQAAITYWKGSPIHNQAATSTGYREIGVAAVPHPYGFLYMMVFGSRPNNFPILVDYTTSTIYVPQEQYQYSTGGDWLNSIQQVQTLPDVLSQLDESKWQAWALSYSLPTQEKFAVAFRGAGKTVMVEVDPARNVLILPSTLPNASTEAPTTTGPMRFPTNTPTP